MDDRRRARYPANWPELRRRVMERADWHCEGSPAFPDCRAQNGRPHPVTGSVVVLATAHLYEDDEATQDIGRLRAMCQRCHATHDGEMHARRAAETRERKRWWPEEPDDGLTPADRARQVAWQEHCRQALEIEREHRKRSHRSYWRDQFVPLLRRPLDEQELAQIAARASAATPGPWHWTEDAANAETKHAYVYLLQGSPRLDRFDAQVMGLQWCQVKSSTLVDATPSPADAAFMAHAREDIPRLLATIEQLRARLHEVEAEDMEIARALGDLPQAAGRDCP